MKKKIFLSLLIGAAFAIGFTASDEVYPDEGNSTTPQHEEEQPNTLEAEYITVEDAVYEEGEFPEGNTGEVMAGVSLSNQSLQGGMSYITVVTTKVYKRFFIGVKDVEGYLVYTPQQTAQTRADGSSGVNTYTIPVVYSDDIDDGNNVVILISGEDENGNVDEPYEVEVNILDTQTGDLDIKLAFSNEKDIDLHLYLPDGEHIFYGAKGGTKTLPNGTTVSYGLDHDSNAGCHIDGLNEENIFIPAELIQNGTYRVVVDMYKNCNSSIATNWNIRCRYKGELVPVASGANPASGIYPVGFGNGDMTVAMTFTISDVQASSRAASIIKASYVTKPLTDMDKMKLEELQMNALLEK